MKHCTLATCLALACSTSLAFAAKPLFQESFEDIDTKELKSQNSTWQVTEASVTNRFAKTGKHSLHIHGGKQAVRLHVPSDAQTAKGISFWAERWSGKAPFECTLSATVDGKKVKVSQLDLVIVTGARFKSHIQLPLPEGDKISDITFEVVSADKAGLLLDDIELLSEAPANPTEIPRLLPPPTEPLKLLSSATVFKGGEDKTNTYRIPSIITAQNGDLIAACDARRNNAGDLIHFGSRDIDIVIKRSTDNGKTWGPMEIVADFPAKHGGTDPSMVLDRETGEIFIFFSYMAKPPSKEFRFMVCSSKDHGKTWSEPRDITEDISKPEWKNSFKFISSGRASQTADGKLIHNYVILGKGVKIFSSDDHGKTWKLEDAEIKPADESRVLELTDGRLMVNSRVGGGYRWVHVSEDKGKTWSSKKEHQLIDPRCNGAIIRYTSKKDGYAKDRLLFCNAGSQKGRKNLTVRISYDEGKTWSEGKVIDSGPSAYSEITILEDGSIGVFYEPGYKSLKFVRFTLEELTDGKDKLSKPYEIK
ncbi:hypothetical protein Rhal01_01430 [Rubritalea halochordaticola]|uniref:exo-alpha-sialidase n=1 Tax=Rubritalea halochordaticola TaxID=714537 RepID=A0ABP9UXX2_9BACT